MKKTNYHCHTYRCGHATGNEEDMVVEAISHHYEELGFSDHIPLPHLRRQLIKALPYALKDCHSFLSCIQTMIKNGPSMRMPYKMKEEHQLQIKQLKIKYPEIKIYQGYEAEYFLDYLPYYQQLLDNEEVDYLILGHHFHRYAIHNCYYGRVYLSDDMLLNYKNEVIQAIESNLFSYIAHPDLFMMGRIYFDDLCKEVSYEICMKAKQYNMPLEINGGGMRKGRRQVGDEMLYPYPNDHFFKIASQVGNKVILGIDAHCPQDINNEIYDQMLRYAKRFNLEIIDHLEFKKGNRK
ncbi:histidinol-phosphatase [Erysipelatoclostridium sp. AM42-17]|uniref:histidinol-phosphatase n=1 Tax=Erysipelatoclostridium sp. AM42-17 TaxID=2293102 RepID=UPI000E4BB1CC|nr:histidinol-phosphatase [Erysipelatoclostridium sp. AM42-17]RHS92950.1 histidinol phosphate phosphatase [Erysipelatoclostridium sp. AM42-17]